MKSFTKISKLLLSTIITALCLSWLLYYVQSLILADVTNAKPFHFLKIYSRCLTVVLFVFVFIYIKKITKRSFLEFGLQKDETSFKMLSSGFLFGIFSMIILIMIQFFTRESILETSNWNPKFYFDLVFQLFVVFTIAVVEEWFFRGFVYSELKMDLGVPKAVILSSAFFAITHFVRPTTHWQVLIPEFFGLFLIGVILTNAFEYSKSLYLSIGIHAGWVYVVKLDKYFINHFDSVLQKTFGGEKLLKSIPAWILILLILFFLKRFVLLIQTKKTKGLSIERRIV